MTAELSALIFALSWTMTVPNDVPLSIHSDSLVSLNFADATFADADNGALPEIARSLTTAARMKTGRIVCTQVRVVANLDFVRCLGDAGA